MRYDTPVFFQRVRPGEYDPSTGNHEPDTITEEKRYASVADAGANTMTLVYGEFKQGSLTIQLQTHYKKAFDRVRMGEKVYRIDFERKFRVKHYLVVSEVE